MSRNAAIDRDFGDGEHRFRLAIGQLEELQEKTGVSPFTVLARLVAYQPMVKDTREILRLGLVGGGMKPEDALALMRRYCGDDAPLADHIPLATIVLQTALMGVSDEDPGKSAGEGMAEPLPPTA